MTAPSAAPGRWTALGLLLVSLATLMHEILLTRIFSVTLWYHFAFMAISIAMFGMALGAIVVYLRPRVFTPEKTLHHLALFSLFFAVSVVLSFVVYAQIPTFLLRLTALPYVSLAYVVSAVPFGASGVAVCLALTRFPRGVGRLYAADLGGAALGCLLLVVTLKLTDGPTAVLVVATLGAAGAAAFAVEAGGAALRRATLVATLGLAAVTVGHALLVRHHAPLLRLTSAKGFRESPALYEKWTTFSRIRVEGDPQTERRPFGWGLSPAYVPPHPVRELDITIDAASGTVMTAFDGDLRKHDYLTHDVTNVAHHLRKDAKVLVIGAGGGRDILSALVFDQRSVTGIEINEAILDALNRELGDYSGHLDRQPKVTFVNDEARSRLARDPQRFDILQVSLIDTWAATAAGALALTENSLYTLEAWKIFLGRLEPHGLLSFSRWYRPLKPHEFYRLVCLAATSLRAEGVTHPRAHLVVVSSPSSDADVGTLLVSREPFSTEDLERLRSLAERMQFRLLLTPQSAADPVFAQIADAPDPAAFAREFPVDISAPTDDRPFFFQTVRMSDLWKTDTWGAGNRDRAKAFLILGVLLATVLGLTFCCLLLPLLLTARRDVLRGRASLFVFFAAIGLGFMFVEVAQMQRLSLFLGHPAYSLSVVLFSLLLSCGIGSLLAPATARLRILVLLTIVLMAFGALTPFVTHALQAAQTPTRLVVAALLLIPCGLLMGMAFPLGMRVAGELRELTPWLWGLNGASSVCASVLAVAVALGAGIGAAYWVGVAAYVVAALAYRDCLRRPARDTIEVRVPASNETAP